MTVKLSQKYSNGLVCDAEDLIPINSTNNLYAYSDCNVINSTLATLDLRRILVECEYCKRVNDFGTQLCASCGAPLRMEK